MGESGRNAADRSAATSRQHARSPRQGSERLSACRFASRFLDIQMAGAANLLPRTSRAALVRRGRGRVTLRRLRAVLSNASTHHGKMLVTHLQHTKHQQRLFGGVAISASARAEAGHASRAGEAGRVQGAAPCLFPGTGLPGATRVGYIGEQPASRYPDGQETSRGPTKPQRRRAPCTQIAGGETHTEKHTKHPGLRRREPFP